MGPVASLQSEDRHRENMRTYPGPAHYNLPTDTHSPSRLASPHPGTEAQQGSSSPLGSRDPSTGSTWGLLPWLTPLCLGVPTCEMGAKILAPPPMSHGGWDHWTESLHKEYRLPEGQDFCLFYSLFSRHPEKYMAHSRYSTNRNKTNERMRSMQITAAGTLLLLLFGHEMTKVTQRVWTWPGVHEIPPLPSPTTRATFATSCASRN